ncbi:LysR family transcriptional regulator [Catenovulum agarivorans]|uniref:LysR family transcriptional regulator n=1 Tax=Catenovulum agarivorans TaxID=1172192 RepID=UPI0002F476D7|nr:LysR family transcriptional regulator [Catenovulum agarivorans]
MDKLNCMQAYCAVVKEGGFSAAARKLGISKVMVSRAVSSLESELGIRLLHRTTRQMSTTAEGQAYYERCFPLLEEFQLLDEAIKSDHAGAKGKLRLAAPAEAFSQQYLTPVWVKFAQTYPEIELDITMSDRYIDIVEEGYDAAIRIGKLQDSSLIAKKLADMELVLCASTEYLQQHPTIEHPQQLLDHQLVVDSNFRGGQSWPFTKEAEEISIRASGKVRVNSTLAVASFIQAGLGIGLCLSFLVEDKIKSGELVRILPEWELMKGGIYILYSHRKHLSNKVQVFSQFLAENCFK